MFLLRRLLPMGKKKQETVFADPQYDGHQIHFKYNGDDTQIHHLETLIVDLCLKPEQMPPLSALQISPHQDQIKQGTHGPIFSFHHSRDMGRRMTCSLTHFDQKKKKIRKGDKLFKGILKSVLDDPLQLLMFA